MDLIIIASLVLNLITIVFLLILVKKNNKSEGNEITGEIKIILNELFERNEKILKDEFSRNREEAGTKDRSLREELNKSINNFSEQLFNRMGEVSKLQKDQLEIFANQLTKLTHSNEEKFERLQDKISLHLKEIRENNDKKLEEMRVTVDEKLHTTLEKRLGESFKLVSDRLEIVHKGLGEMQTLANGVGDLKRVLSNVKTRGTWGEIQLENLIDQILAPEQYSRNVSVKKGSMERVDFAVKLPGKGDLKDDVVWLPIDAKFPLEDYQRLVEAQENVTPELVEEAAKQIEKRVKENAKSIATKYINPPFTTDFAIMFLPIEGLYAEILRRPGLAEQIQRDFRIILAGPTNIAALLNSLQMGFKTLAIEKRSSEVWKLLGVVKSEFGKFGDILEKTQVKLEQASKTIGDASKKTRTIERKLRDVEELPSQEADILIE
ncbi:MAG: DNA recombination protein RmuC [Rhodothermaceae bacterium]